MNISCRLVFRKGLQQTSGPKRRALKKYKGQVTLPYVANLSEQLKHLFSKHRINTSFKPSNVPKGRKVWIVYSIACGTKGCYKMYSMFGKTAQPFETCISQHRRSTTLGPASTVYTHMKETPLELRTSRCCTVSHGGSRGG